MFPQRFLLGGLKLGEADIMRQRGLDGAGVMREAAQQFELSHMPYGVTASERAQQIAKSFKRLKGDIGAVLVIAQNDKKSADYHAVSCGWWLGQAYGCCLHQVGDIQSDQLEDFVLKGQGHAMVLTAEGHSKWPAGDVQIKFRAVASALKVAKLHELREVAGNVKTLAAQFANTLH